MRRSASWPRSIRLSKSTAAGPTRSRRHRSPLGSILLRAIESSSQFRTRRSRLFRRPFGPPLRWPEPWREEFGRSQRTLQGRRPRAPKVRQPDPSARLPRPGVRGRACRGCRPMLRRMSPGTPSRPCPRFQSAGQPLHSLDRSAHSLGSRLIVSRTDGGSNRRCRVFRRGCQLGREKSVPWRITHHRQGIQVGGNRDRHPCPGMRG